MKPVRIIGIAILRLYQWLLSPLLAVLFNSCCRFSPSCSHYAMESLERHGVIKGGFLTLKRLARCNPFCTHGYDPVPPLSRK